ncbi:MAG: hypothetical protein CVV57_07565 [Tenericutes bacterium HGW-Tenericutes-2]|jgi:hypothetical protein|nr:MAG: hypothetical protein CVV57_07565 [Tenericutes bacterium HGW-Tenericutes-2]
MSINKLFSEELKVVNIGSPSFKNDYEKQEIEYIHLNWAPPASGNLQTLNQLSQIRPYMDKIHKANEQAVQKIKAAEARLIAVKKAYDVIPNMSKNTILHAGPPIEFKRMAGPMRGAIIGALIYEGLAKNEKEAIKLAESGDIEFDSAHHHDAVGPMAGIISASMPVHVLYNIIDKNYSYCTINEGLGKVLRYGANSEDVIKRLKWIEHTFQPVMNEALILSGGIDVKSIITQALHMGDECHNRNKASSALFLREIATHVLSTQFTDQEKKEVIEFIKNNEHYFLNLSMPYCKLALDSARNIKYSTVVIAMSRNGVDFGIQLAHSNTWYKAPANYVKGLMFPGFNEDDAAPDIGDSAITETCGIGGFAMGGAPAIVQFVGGVVKQAFDYSKEMHEITAGRHQVFTLPPLDFMPTAVGIEMTKVLETGILPIINTGMAHKDAGVGQVGAGLVHPPMACFEKALKGFLEELKEDNK